MKRSCLLIACAMLFTVFGCSSETPSSVEAPMAVEPEVQTPPRPPGKTFAEFEPEADVDQHKKIVLIAGDSEYRSEETMPALARILARLGFHTVVLFTQDPAKNGDIVPQFNNVPGLEHLDDADLMVIFTRFLDLPSDQMQHIADYVESGRPVVGIRTATHAFEIADPNSKFAKYGRKYEGQDDAGGFGMQVLGANWETHQGKNHEESTRGVIADSAASHPILRGVHGIWGPTGAYGVHPVDSQVLVYAQVLDGMTPDSPPAIEKNEPMMPLAWTHDYTAADGKKGRAFVSLLGASEDLVNLGTRRMLVNACYWALGLDDQIKPNLDVDFVVPFEPSPFGKDKHKRGLRPADWEE